MEESDLYRWVKARILRTQLGNWYAIRPGAARAHLIYKVTEHPADWLSESRFEAIGRIPGSQFFNGKIKTGLNI